MVKTAVSRARGEGSIPGQGAKTHVCTSKKQKPKHKSNIVTNSIKT